MRGEQGVEFGRWVRQQLGWAALLQFGACRLQGPAGHQQHTALVAPTAELEAHCRTHAWHRGAPLHAASGAMLAHTTPILKPCSPFWRLLPVQAWMLSMAGWTPF